MALRQLGSIAEALDWLGQRGVRALAVDSRRIEPGAAFIAWPGYAVDGRRYVPEALAAGASACLVEAEGAAAFAATLERPEVATLAGLKAATGPLASAFMDTPSERLAVIAVTGTNGKTSTTWWVAQALSSLAQRCGVIGTLGVGEPPSPLRPMALAFTGLTTPDPVTLQAGLQRFVAMGFAACAIEATSIGLREQRLAGTRIRTALFTNLTRDHIDYHGSMDAYWEAKAELFAWPGLQAAVINVDDAQGAQLAGSLAGRPELDLWTCSAGAQTAEAPPARLRASRVRYEGGGLAFELHEGSVGAAVRTRLIGTYNVANLLAVVGALRAGGTSLADAAAACALLTPVPGRMQRVAAGVNDPQVVVDYAHTPDALEKALLALQPFAQERGGVLWCVFGCGGDRDPGKRPLMGALAERLAQRVVVTSDNPRGEAPGAIVAQILAGCTGPAGTARLQVIEDRRAAIAQAVRGAAARDVILVAGKGHETYQEIAGVRQPFSDVEQAVAALASRQGAVA